MDTISDSNPDPDSVKLEILKESKSNLCLEEHASFFSRLFFYWTGRLISEGNKKFFVLILKELLAKTFFRSQD